MIKDFETYIGEGRMGRLVNPTGERKEDQFKIMKEEICNLMKDYASKKSKDPEPILNLMKKYDIYPHDDEILELVETYNKIDKDFSALVELPEKIQIGNMIGTSNSAIQILGDWRECKTLKNKTKEITGYIISREFCRFVLLQHFNEINIYICNGDAQSWTKRLQDIFHIATLPQTGVWSTITFSVDED